MDKDFVITLRLRPDQVNLVLVKLGACPFAEVAEVISHIKMQGDAALKSRQQQLQAEIGNGLEETSRNVTN